LTQATSGSVQELVRTHSRSYAHMHTRNHTHSLSHIHTHTLAAHTSICSFKTRNFSAARSFRRASSSSFSCSVRGAVSGRRGGGTGACSCVDVCACVCVCVCVCVCEREKRERERERECVCVRMRACVLMMRHTDPQYPKPHYNQVLPPPTPLCAPPPFFFSRCCPL
jgi:hypothetical protein